jgi:crotonobetainyl-CoA:carnitine CoA-transferase CaiB-like acyl-CoA transferase
VKPLNNITVLECGTGLTAPYTSSLLGDLGANVVKIEGPERDASRSWPPIRNGFSYYYAAINRNKRNIVINLKTEGGREVFYKLAGRADVILENFTPGTVDRLGIGYYNVKKINPKIIYCHISGFGWDSPYRDRAAFDYIMQGETGWMSFTGTPETPCRIGIPITDFITSLYALSAILSALIYRDRYGEGVEIDISMWDCQLTSLLALASIYWVENRVPGRMGMKYFFGPAYQPYRAKDGRWIILGIATTQHWRKFCEKYGLKKLLEDYPTIIDVQERRDKHSEMEEEIGRVIAGKESSEWVKLLTEDGIPSGVINNIAEVLNHSQTVSRGMIAKVIHKKLGEIKVVKSPFKTSRFNVEVVIPPSLPGEHTDEIMRELGYSEEEIKELKEIGAIS